MQRIATIPAIVVQHVEDAAFLWSRRRREIDGSLLGEVEIGRLDQRLTANLEGLFASGEAAWDLAIARFADYQERAELFVIGVLAIHYGTGPAMAAALDGMKVLGEDGIHAMSAAAARSRPGLLRPHLMKWLGSNDPCLRNLALRALLHNRAGIDARLLDVLGDEDPHVRIVALRHAGALKRRDVLSQVLAAFEAATAEERLAAATAACLIGEPRLAYPVLDKLVGDDAHIALQAMEMRILATPAQAGRAWLQERINQPAYQTIALSSIGIFGEKSIMPWLVEKMREPDLAYAAGQALRDLFEVNFNDTGVFTSDLIPLGENFAVLQDVPVPVADRALAWWSEGAGQLKHERFLSMRRLRQDTYRAALANPAQQLSDWRRTRPYPAWM